jgi:hypothetical protein
LTEDFPGSEHERSARESFPGLGESRLERAELAREADLGFEKSTKAGNPAFSERERRFLGCSRPSSTASVGPPNEGSNEAEERGWVSGYEAGGRDLRPQPADLRRPKAECGHFCRLEGRNVRVPSRNPWPSPWPGAGMLSRERP